MNTELELKGVGVEPVSIPEIDAAVEGYIAVRDAFVTAAGNLQAEQEQFRRIIHAHEDKLTKSADGTITYRFDDQILTVKPGKEKIKIKDIGEKEE